MRTSQAESLNSRKAINQRCQHLSLLKLYVNNKNGIIMPVYFLAQISEVTNKEMYLSYVQQASPIIQKYGGKYIFKSNKVTPVAGNRGITRAVLITFKDLETLKNCFNSEEYHKIKHLRENSVKSKAIIIE